MTLLTGHGKDPPICGARDCRDGDKMLCKNKYLTEFIGTWAPTKEKGDADVD